MWNRPFNGFKFSKITYSRVNSYFDFLSEKKFIVRIEFSNLLFNFWAALNRVLGRFENLRYVVSWDLNYLIFYKNETAIVPISDALCFFTNILYFFIGMKER